MSLAKFPQRFVSWIAAHQRGLSWLFALLFVVAAARTVLTYSHLKSDLEALLPESAPSVSALKVARQRLSGVRHLGIVVLAEEQSAVPEAAELTSQLAQRLEQQLPKSLVNAVRRDAARERDFIELHALSLMEAGDVKRLREAVSARKDYELGRAYDLGLEDEESGPAPEIPWKELSEKYQARFGVKNSGRAGPFASPDGKTQVVVLQVASQATSYESDRQLLNLVEAEVSKLGFREHRKGKLRLGYAGDVAARVEEMEGLMEDLGISSVLVIGLVIFVIVAFYRTWRALPVLGIPLALGTCAAFALAALPPLSIRELNTNTAFLGSVVIGNGINSAIILLARYQEERRAGWPADIAVERAWAGTWLPTLGASAAAAVAYGSLIVTQFRGFNQFGWIGGIGMLSCWAANYSLMPILLPKLDPAPKKDEGAVKVGLWRRSYLAVVRRPKPLLALLAVTFALASVVLVEAAKNPMEHDLSKLRRRDSWVNGERFYGKKMDQALGRYLTPSVILTSNSEQSEKVERGLRELQKKGGAGGLIGKVASARDLVRPDQAESLREAAALKELLSPALLEKLPAEQRALVAKATSPEALQPYGFEQLPTMLTTGMREIDGSFDRTVLLYPRLSNDTWNAQYISAFSKDLRKLAAEVGPEVKVVSSLCLSSDMTEVMKHDGPRATAVSLASVLVICLLAFRSWRLSVIAVVSLLFGVVFMMALGVSVKMKLNFSNFVALPITFGIAADYSLNILRRLVQDGAEHLEAGLEETSGAVALCSITTIIGFGSLLVAEQQALFSFGALAVSGEVTCLMTALLLVPAVFQLWKKAGAGLSSGMPAQGGTSEAS